jgi:transposase
MGKRYPTDLSDAQWNYIEPHLPAPEEVLRRAWAREWNSKRAWP